MVNINCSLNCIYQNDGKCMLQQIPATQKYSNNIHLDCVYYMKRIANMNK